MWTVQKMKQERLDKISDFIAYITLNGATEDEIRRATEYSKAVIDRFKAEEELFNAYQKVVEDTKIYELMRKYKKQKDEAEINELMHKYKERNRMRPIDADNTIEKLDCLFKETDVKSLNFMVIGYNHAVADSIAVIKGQPTADVTDRKVGKWIHGKEKAREMRGSAIVSIIYDGWYCPECGKKVEDESMPIYRFCRYCGTEMEGAIE